MSENDDFQIKYFAAKTHIEKIQLFIREGRYAVIIRADKPNLNSEVYLLPILNLPANYLCIVKAPRRTGGAGANYVVEIKYSAKILGLSLSLYFKGFYGPFENLILRIQSLRVETQED